MQPSKKKKAKVLTAEQARYRKKQSDSNRKKTAQWDAAEILQAARDKEVRAPPNACVHSTATSKIGHHHHKSNPMRSPNSKKEETDSEEEDDLSEDAEPKSRYHSAKTLKILEDGFKKIQYLDEESTKRRHVNGSLTTVAKLKNCSKNL
ncbi:hypothetical protein CAEBREN_05786 [Caenorhabditis brenneri]|uniref:Uncharacterized protein n=1 Tax=Caenorhabditis brenneri TaxID=135651 RepID=G0PA84_CAEBE|nr:hypothetical protein CAEBREN_05786 [Caenorhabditis brenneri]